MSNARTSPPLQTRYAVPATLDLRGGSKAYGSGLAEVHAPRQAAAPYASADVGSSLQGSDIPGMAELDHIVQAPIYRNGLRLLVHHQQP